MKKSAFVYVAARSGGHIVPLIAHAHQQSKEREIIFVTTTLPLDMKIVQDAGSVIDKHYALHVGNIPRSLFRVWSYVKSVGIALKRSYIILKDHKPEGVYTTGGYLGALVTFVAFLMRIPVHVYHLDAIPGKAGGLIHCYADHSYVCVAQAYTKLPALSRATIHFTECPLRFSEKDRQTKTQAATLLGIDPQRRTILIMGGSQGSRSINEIVQKTLMELSSQEREHIYVIHQTGIHEHEILKNFYASQHIEVLLFGYDFNLAPYYNAADYVISRAGAGSLAEICFFEKPALVMPLKEAAQNHQVYNVLAYQKKFPRLIFPVLTDDMQVQKGLVEKVFLGEPICS